MHTMATAAATGASKPLKQNKQREVKQQEKMAQATSPNPSPR